ncbi:uncharacterized protein LOC117814453 [Notolabrus celidotus]|uniref:uncharacterized protein LOC117814453 n=1 Tax=Notolabrus celidotus TaxID=1203425 RepID=UPI0014900A47|nr:uncharacterized protein LOC117814453 [Notolabrus celidotus]
MALLSRVSWICTVLLLSYICFPPQKGYSFAHGYSPHNDAYRSHVDMYDPLNSYHDSGHTYGSDPVYYEDSEDASFVASSVTSLSEEMVHSRPDSDHEAELLKADPSAPSVLKSDHEASGSQHPFGLLLKEHTQRKTAEGVSFPTMMDLKKFIDRMKSSFLKPGSDVGRHFQTARDVMKNKISSDAQITEEVPDSLNTPDSAEDVKEQDEADGDEVWSDSNNMQFEESEEGPDYQMQGESLSLHDPVDPAASFITNGAYYNQGQDMDSAFYQHYLLAEHASNENEQPDHVGDTFIDAPQSQNYEVWTTHSEFPEQIPSDSFFGEDFSFPHSPDYSYHSSKTTNMQSITAENNIQPPKYTPYDTGNVEEHYYPSAGREFSQDFQKDEAASVTDTTVMPAPKPESLNSYGKSVYVNAPRGQLPIPEYEPKQREIPAPTFPSYQPAVGQESVAFVSLSSENPSSESISGRVGALTSSPHYIAVKPPSHYLDGNHREHPVQTFISPAKVEKEEKLNPTVQNLISATQNQKTITDNFLPSNSVGSDSKVRISSQVGTGYSSFNSFINLAPASETTFSRPAGHKVMSRNLGLQNELSGGHFRFLSGDVFGAKRHLGSFPTPEKQGFSVNGGYTSAVRAGHFQTFIQPNEVWKHPSFVRKERKTNKAFQYLRPLSASSVSDSTVRGLFWRTGVNTQRLPPQTGAVMSPLSSHSYTVKSENNYSRGKLSQSKTYYDPNQLNESRYSQQGNPWQQKHKGAAVFGV